jgi:hypothetical protein
VQYGSATLLMGGDYYGIVTLTTMLNVSVIRFEGFEFCSDSGYPSYTVVISLDVDGYL